MSPTSPTIEADRPTRMAAKPRSVCVEVYPSDLSQGIHRVARALRRFAPEDVRLVTDPAKADLRVIHVIGWGSIPDDLLTSGQPYAIIQYCVQTSERPAASEWIPVWRQAVATWSYYDLPAYCDAANLEPDFTFYHAPLGVDANVFRVELPRRKRFTIGTSGYIAETEGTTEAYAACRHHDLPMFHLGPNLNLGPGITYMTGMSDVTLARLWSQCSYVAALRRCEGFELPAYEGLLCGSRPVAFASPHYEHWLEEHAEYVPEGTPEEVTDALIELFAKPVRPVTPRERLKAAERFNWASIADGFWEHLR